MGLATTIMKNKCLPFPKIVQFEITNRCPFKCPQCYRMELDEQDIEINYLKSMILQCKENGTNLIVLNGGEPLLYKNIIELLTFLKEVDIQVNCFSSGFGITEEIIPFLNMPFFHYFISLNGSTRAINSLSREGYDDAINAMSYLQNAGVIYGVHWVARHDNVVDFSELISFVENKGGSFISIGGNKLTYNRSIDSPLVYDDLKKLVSVIKEYKGNVKLLVENCYPELTWALGLNLNMLFSGCGAGRTICHVTLDGKYAPCTHMHYYEQWKTIEDYWNNSKVLNDIRNRSLLQFDSCSSCKFLTKCRMCLATSEESYRNFNLGNVDCHIKKENVL